MSRFEAIIERYSLLDPLVELEKRLAAQAIELEERMAAKEILSRRPYFYIRAVKTGSSSDEPLYFYDVIP